MSSDVKTEGNIKDEPMKSEPSDNTTTTVSSSSPATVKNESESKSSVPPPLESENEDVCEICFSGDIEDDNLIVYCLAGGTPITLADGSSKSIEYVKVGDVVMAHSPVGAVPRKVTAFIPNGVRSCVELIFEDGRRITCTPDHRMLTNNGEWIEAGKLVIHQSEVVALEQKKAIGRDLVPLPTYNVKLVARRVAGDLDVFDITVPAPVGQEGSFFASGLAVHNCDGTGADGHPCTTTVHQFCYGCFKIPEGDEPWFCDMCAVKQGLKKVHPNLKKTVDKCLLCPEITGAFKPLHDNSGWCHATCAVWIPETGFFDPSKMESIIGVDAIERSRFKLVCELCNVREGACIQCMAHACRYSFHPRCGGRQRKTETLMEMEAVSIGQSYDVLKLTYCQKHRYLGSDPIEKKILIRKWQLTGSLDDGPDESRGGGGGGTSRKRKLIKPTQQKKRGRPKKRNPDGSDSEEEEEEEEDGSDRERGTGIDDDLSSSGTDRNSSDEFSEDEDGKRVRKVKAYMCADCMSTKRSHKCPFGQKKKKYGTGSGSGAAKRRKLDESIEEAHSVDQFVVKNPYPHLFFPSTSSLHRKKWRADETDSDCDSVDIHEDPLLSKLVQEAFEEIRLRDEEAERNKPQPKLRAMPFQKSRKYSNNNSSSSSAPKQPRAPAQPKQQRMIGYGHLDPKSLTPDAVQELWKQTKAQLSGAPAPVAAALPVAGAAAGVGPDGTTPFQNQQVLAFQQILQQQLQHLMAFAQAQAQLQAQAEAQAAATAQGTTEPIPPIPAVAVPDFLASPEAYQALLEAFIAHQKAAEAARELAYQQHYHASLEAEAEKARIKAEAKAKSREERQKEKDALRAEREKARAEERAQKELARKNLAAARAMQPSMPKRIMKRQTSTTSSSAASSYSQPKEQPIMLTPQEELALRTRLQKFVNSPTAKEKLTAIVAFLEMDTVDAKPFAVRLLSDSKGLELLKRWMESAIVAIQAAEAMLKKQGGSTTTTTTAGSAVSLSAMTDVTPSAMTDSSSAASTESAPAPAPATGASAFFPSMPTPVASSSITSTAVMSPLATNIELVVACLKALERIADMVADITRQPAYPSTYQVLQKLSLMDQPKIKELAQKLKSKFPNPYGPGPQPVPQHRVIPKLASGPSAASTSSGPGPQPLPARGPVPLQRGPQPISAAGGGGAGNNAMRMVQQQALRQQQQSQQQAAAASMQQQQQHMLNDQRRNPYQPPQQPPPQQSNPYQQSQSFQPQQQPSQFGGPNGHPMQQQQQVQQQQFFPNQPQQQQQMQGGGFPHQQQQPMQAHPQRQQMVPPQQQTQQPYVQQQQSQESYYQQQQPQQQQQQPQESPPATAPAPVSSALSALSAMLQTSEPSAAQQPTPSAGPNMSQLTQWLNNKVPGSGPAGAASTAGSSLQALLAKVSGTAAPPAANIAPPAQSATPPLQQQLADLNVHARHWDEQYRTLWNQHNSTLGMITHIQSLTNVLEKLARMPELPSLNSRANQLADQLRNVQAQQADIARRVAIVKQQIAQEAAQRPPQQQTPGPPQDPRTLLITNLSPSSSEASLRQLFSHLGTMVSCQLCINPSTGMSAGMAYVSYSTVEDAMRVAHLAQQNTLQLDGRVLAARPTMQPQQQQLPPPPQPTGWGTSMPMHR